MSGEDHTPTKSTVFKFSIIPEWVLDNKELPHGAVRLYGVLARYADKEGTSFPSRTTLSNRLNCTPITVDRWAKKLVNVGALSIVRRKNNDGTENLTNLWTIHRVPSYMLPPSKTDDSRVGAQVMPRTITNERKPNKDITNLIDELIEKEEGK